MKTNRYFAIVLVAVLVSATVWIIAEAGVKSEPPVKNNESGKQNAEYPYLTPEDYENFRQIVKKSRFVSINENQIDILKVLEATKVFGGIKVFVQELNPDVERLGLTKQALQTDVELLLRKYGIEVVKSGLVNYLDIGVSALPDDSGIIAFGIDVEFHDLVIPLRNPTIIIMNATVWESGSVGSVGEKRIGDLREAVEGHVKIFINDYLAANPKEQSTK